MTATSIDSATGNLLVGGSRVFPLGLSDPPPVDGMAPNGKPAWAEVASAGVNFARNYTTWTAAAAAEQLLSVGQQLEVAAQHGMQMWVALAGIDNDLSRAALLDRIVNTVKSHPGLGVWKGDRVAACVVAASVLAKVTRDRIMIEMHEEFPDYGFADHKGYVTEEHSSALHHHGPCIQHRFSYANVAAAGKNVVSSDVAGLQDAVVGSARSRRRSTVSVAAVADPGGPADAVHDQWA